MNENQIMDALTREGVLLNASVRYWRATKKLNAEDLGLDPDKITDRLISLGHKKLLPKEALAPFALIESRTHALVEASTFPFLKGLSRFLPNAKLVEITNRMKEMAAEFERARARFLEQYAGTRAKALVEWRDAARQLVAEPERLVASIEAAFPDPQRMGRYFEFSVQLFQIRAPEALDVVLVDQAEQEQVMAARRNAAETAREQIHQGAQAFLTDCVATLRHQTAELCEEMLKSMQTGKTGVHQKTLNRLVRFIDEFKQLNFVGDREMEAQLDRVRQEFLLRSAEDYRDDTTAKSHLQQGLQALADHARELANKDSRDLVERFGQVGHRRFHLAAA